MTNLLRFWIFLLISGAVFAAAEPRTVLFYGDSLSAGYGLEDPAGLSFPGLIQAKITEAGLPYRVVNAGLSGETTAGGLRRIDWILRQQVDVFILELGGNDGLRGLPVATSRGNLVAIIERVRAKNPSVKILLAGMQMPTSMGPDYTVAFAAMFPEIAEQQKVTLIPFLLEDVGGMPSMNLPDGIHPNPEGHRRVAETVWTYLKPLL
jgi:acyl-CoA thioesterase I